MKRIIIGLMLVLSFHTWGQDAERGKSISTTCVACHGMDGNSSANPLWPKLAGQHENYIKRQLMLFKNGQRENASMSPMVVSLTEQDMADLAAYYAAQKPVGAAADPDQVELGELIYKVGNKERKIPACMACHGPAGRGNPLSGYPVLSGQHAAYTAQRLRAYRDGEIVEEDTANGKIMAQVARYLDEDEIIAVSSYLQGLSPTRR